MASGAGDSVLLIQLKRVGDVLLCTPLVRALREDGPARRISFLTEEPNADLLRGNPRIDSVLTIPPRMGVIAWSRLCRRLRADRPDAVLDLAGTPRSCFITVISGARSRVGFQVRLPRRWAYNNVIIPDRSKYTVDRRLDLLRAIGVPDRGFATELWLDEQDRAEADRLLVAAGFAPGAPLLAIAPTSRKGAKRWSPDGFAQISAWARERFGAEILLLSGFGEEEQENEVRDVLPGGARRLPEIPRLRTLAALIERSRVLLANDGGPKHIAVALGVPTVTVFVSTAASSWHPPRDPHHIAIGSAGDLDADAIRVREALSEIWNLRRPPPVREG